MEIRAYTSPYLASNMYVVREGDGCAFAVDPFWTEDAFRGVTQLDFIVLTHEHCDHITGAEVLRKRYGCKVICSAGCGERAGDAGGNLSAYFSTIARLPEFRPYGGSGAPLPLITLRADQTFTHDMLLNWRKHAVYMRVTPGHTRGSACCLVDGHHLFTGDTLLRDLPVETRFPSGSRAAFMQQTLPWLRSLYAEAHVYPGHFEGFRLADGLKRYGEKSR